MIRMRPMTIADIPLGLRLKSQANWNQLEADWRRMLEMEPGGGFVAEYDGEPVGTVYTCLLGSVAWIAMVLVDERLRGKGLGTALMQQALEYLDARGVPTVRLDATPMGRPLYEKLGFVPEYTLARYAGTPMLTTDVAEVKPYLSKYREAVITLDSAVVDTDRQKLLTRLLAERPSAARVTFEDDQLVGYRTSRLGALATLLGPCIATTEAAGQRLLTDAFVHHMSERVYIDIPLPNHPATACAESAGLTIQRPLLRMYRGIPPVDQVENIWASSGPEMG